MPDRNFIQNIRRGNPGEEFVQRHLAEITNGIYYDLRDRTEEHVEGRDATGVRLQIGAPTENDIPDFVNIPGIHDVTVYAIDAIETGGIEVKTVWNFLFRTNDNEDPSGSIGFALWSDYSRTHYGWLMKILRPEAFYEPGQRMNAVRPLQLIYLLVEYEDAYACIAFKDVAALCERLRELAREHGFDLDNVPLGEQAQNWAPEGTLIVENVWFPPLSELADLAFVTMIGSQPRLRGTIALGANKCSERIQNARYSYLASLADGKHMPPDTRFAGAFVPAAGHQIYADIDHNLRILDSIDPDRYPALAQYGSKRVFQHLRELMYCMLSFAAPSWPENRPRFFAISNSYFNRWLNDRHVSGSQSSIQGHFIFLKDCGLITSFRPIGDTQDRTVNAIMASIRNRRGVKNITLRSVPRYDDSVLKNADEIAALYLYAKAPLARLRKADVIHIRGLERANNLYLDGRVISNTLQYVENLYADAVADLVGEKGYATSEEVHKSVVANMFVDLGFVPLDPLSRELTEEEREQRELQSKYFDALRTIEARKRFYIERAGYAFHPLRNQDRLSFSIPDEITSWIITAL